MIPPSPSPTESKILFYTSLSLLLSRIQGYCYHLSKFHIYVLVYAGQEATVRTGHETPDWFQIGEGVRQGCILSPCLLNVYAEYRLRNTGWKKHKLESRLPGEISITSDMQMTLPYGRKFRGTKNPLDESERGE